MDTLVIRFFLDNGEEIVSINRLDEIGSGYDPVIIAHMEDDEIHTMLHNVQNGQEFLSRIDSQYGGRFRCNPPLEQYMTNKYLYRAHLDLYQEANHEAIAAIDDFSHVICIDFEDTWYEETKTFTYIPNENR